MKVLVQSPAVAQHMPRPSIPPRKRRRAGLPFWRLAATAVMSALVALFLANAYLASLPTVADAQARVDGLLAQHGGVPASALPTRVAEATVAVEDHRFYLHHGIDSLGLLRAAWDLATTGSPRGGATITEQLAQALYSPEDNGVLAHLEKVGLAITLERRYTKGEILTMYLNSVYYGDGQWGIEQASHAYFGVAAGALSWGQATMLAGLPNAPSAYDPRHHYTLARERQRLVLISLVNDGTLSQVEAAAVYAQPPRLA